MMRSSPNTRRDVTGIIVLICFLVLAGVVVTASNETGPQVVSIETTPDPSVGNTRASGSRGLYEWVSTIGYAPAIWRRNFLSLPEDAQVLFCIAPNLTPAEDVFGMSSEPRSSEDLASDKSPNQLTGAEGQAVKQWLRRGHTLILFASSLPAGIGPHHNVLHKSGGAGDGAQDTFGSEIGVGIESQLRSSNSRSYYAPMQPSVWTSGVNSIHIDPRYGIYRASNDAIVLFGSVFALESRLGTRYQCEPLVITYSMGRGRVIVVSDDLFGSNANMARPGTAEFIERILSQSARPGAKILFDEYHRGAAPASKTLWAAIGMPAQYAAVQLLIAALIAALVLIPRLGRSEPLADRQARTSAEYIASLAGLYRNAGASGAALEAIYRQFLREICQRFALPPDISLDRLAQTASHRGGVNLNNLRRCLIACERAIESPTRPSDRDLVALVRAIEQFRKEMWIG